MDHSFYATTALGMEPLLAEEVRSLGGRSLRPGQGGVSFVGPLRVGLGVCLWSRVAGRLLLPLARLSAETPEALYEGVKGLSWEDHIPKGGSLAIDFSGTNAAFRHTRFGAQKVKDAIVDRLLERQGVRPDVQFERPDIYIDVRLQRDTARVSLNLAGEGLHRRGWRVDSSTAPLRETLAAALLLLAGWPAVAAAGGSFMDPMCGSGTLVVEAALMAADMAPALKRAHFGFSRWLGMDHPLWAQLTAEAGQRAEAGRGRLPALRGWDRDEQTVNAARRNAAHAGLDKQVVFAALPLNRLTAPKDIPPGLLVVNPPYGERQGEGEALVPLYQALGRLLLDELPQWSGALFTADDELARATGLSPDESHALYNGPLSCRLWIYSARRGVAPAPAADSAIANRLRKNLKHRGRWAKREGIDCYRLYDADLPEYAAAVDLYGDHVHLQEYQAPSTIAPHDAERRFQELRQAVSGVLEIPPRRIICKVRKAQKDGGQYEKEGEAGHYLTVQEGNLSFLVNLTDYLDTGLFLDHRKLRARIAQEAGGKRFLNLFAYTGTATVHAVAGGARESVSVDLSATYLDWAAKNLRLNGFAGGRVHQLVRADVLQWLEAPAGKPFDLILLAPPSFSRSKRMEETLEIHRDHGALIAQSARLLAPGGKLYFSTHARRFTLDTAALPPWLTVKEIQTVPADFSPRAPNFHRTWEMVRLQVQG